MSDEELMAEIAKATRRLTIEPAIASRFNTRRRLESTYARLCDEAFRRGLIGYPPKRKHRVA